MEFGEIPGNQHPPVRLDVFDETVFSGIYRRCEIVEDDGEYHDIVAGIVSRNYVDVETLFSVGVDIGSSVCEASKSTKGKIIGYLNAMTGIQRVSEEILGPIPGKQTVSALRDYMRLVIVSQLPQTPASKRLFAAIEKTLTSNTNTGNEQFDQNNAWHLSNFYFLKAKFDAYGKVTTIANKYDTSEPSDSDTYNDIRGKANLLTQEAMRHRKYGTKPAYIDASIGGAWIFYDADDWMKRISYKRDRYGERYDDVAAIVCYSPYEEFKSLNFRLSYDKFGQAVVETGDAFEKIDLTLFIRQSGGISLDVDGVADLGLELNISPAQELFLRAEIASNFYDLSMPVMKHRSEEKTFENLVDRKKAKFNPIRDLLIPRVRYIEQTEDFPASDDIVRRIREHDVTWYIRVLPSGWHASPEAAAEAEAHGIELAENETFVKSHTRGSGNRVMGYHAIKRTGRQ